MGGGKNGPLRGTKSALFEGGTKVDSFIYSPLLDEQITGQQYPNLFHVTDWFPTIVDLAGAMSFLAAILTPTLTLALTAKSLPCLFIALYPDPDPNPDLMAVFVLTHNPDPNPHLIALFVPLLVHHSTM